MWPGQPRPTSTRPTTVGATPSWPRTRCRPAGSTARPTSAGVRRGPTSGTSASPPPSSTTPTGAGRRARRRSSARSRRHTPRSSTCPSDRSAEQLRAGPVPRLRPVRTGMERRGHHGELPGAGGTTPGPGRRASEHAFGRRAAWVPWGAVAETSNSIRIRGAREHNLRNVDLELPRDQLIVFTGLSGSGKSSLAFDTIYAEGQRRYVESLSAYARQFLGQMDKPDVDFIEGLSPAISIDQKSASRNPRSTVGTITEIYDYLRLLYARIGVPHCPNCGQLITRQTPQQIVDRVLQLPDGTRFQVLAPVVRGRKGEYHALLDELAGQGFTRARVDGEVVDLPAKLKLERYEQHKIEIVVDRLVRRAGIERRLTDSLETALRLAEGVAEVEIVPAADSSETPETLTFSEHLACAHCGLSFDELAPRNFSFNSPYGACEHCDGLGTRFEVDPELVVSDDDLSVAEGAISPWSGYRGEYFQRVLEAVADENGFSLDTPWKRLKKADQKVVLFGAGKAKVLVKYKNRYGRKREYRTGYEGVIPWLQRRHQEADSDRTREQIEGYMREVPCPA